MTAHPPLWLTQSFSGLQTLHFAQKVAPTALSLYLYGETGVGKDVLAQSIHAWSPRAHGPFVPLHCGALAPSLAESELFGHVRGAFTGASQGRPGALLKAHGGTLFLDEIGELSLDIQVKLLRFLECGEIRPVGSDRLVYTDVRIICATHHRLESLMESGRFRRDLYYRVASVTIPITPLRERPEDIGLIADHFAADLGRCLSLSAHTRLRAQRWNGNVRELRHAIERAIGFAEPDIEELEGRHFDFLDVPVGRLLISGDGQPVRKFQDVERDLILRALHKHDGNRERAAESLGIARSTLFDRLRKYQMTESA